MKQGRSLTDLAAELDRQRNAKRDFVASTAAMEAQVVGEGDNRQFAVELTGQGYYDVNQTAHRQIGEQAKIPAKYYDRMRDIAPDLLAANINHWWHTDPTKRMVRTLDGRARAFVSDRFRCLDNYDLAEAVIPRLIDAKAEVTSCEVTEDRLYIKAVVPGMKREIVTKGFFDFGTHDKVDVIEPGIEIGNSEVGKGSLSVSPGIHTVRCTNLAVWKGSGLRKYHVGRADSSIDDTVRELLSDDTRRQVDRAFWSTVSDMVPAMLGGPIYDEIVASLTDAAQDDIDADPVKVVEVFAKDRQLSDAESSSVLQHLIRGGDLTRYGLHNAVTRMSQDVDSYDRASELEVMGASVIELPRSEWRQINEKATALAA